MPKDIAHINEVAIKENDIVFIKFKPLSEIVEFYKSEGWSPSSFLQESKLDYQLTALMNDGYYKVDDVYGKDEGKSFPQLDNDRNKKHSAQPHEISIINHNHCDGDCFRFNEYIVEEIRVEHDAADTYFSEKFNMSLMKIDGALFINSELVTKKDSKLIQILESTISDLAIQKMLANIEDDE